MSISQQETIILIFHTLLPWKFDKVQQMYQATAVFS